MTYRVAVRRCSACHGRGLVRRPYQVSGVVDYDSYKVLIDRLGLALAVSQPCRTCDGTGRVHRWDQGAPIRYYQRQDPPQTTVLRRNEAGVLEEYRVEKP